MRRAGVIVVAGAALLTAVGLAAARVGERPGALSDRQALILGLVQGFTELLPISSSGHLILVPWLADWRYLETHESFNKTFDVALHLGTLIAVVAYFWEDVVRLVGSWLRSVRRRAIRTSDERVAWFVTIATIPGVIAGAAGEDFIDRRLGEPWQIAILLAAFAIVLYIADRTAERRRMEDLSYREALVVGLAQALALAPGVSRSGISITAGRFLRLDRDSAARFSFLLLIPITFGAVVFKGVKDVLIDDPPPRLGWTLRRRCARLGRHGPRRDLGAPRLPTPQRLLGLRRLPPARSRGRVDPDRCRHPRQYVLSFHRTFHRLDDSFHRLDDWLWKYEKLNFSQIAAFAFHEALHGYSTPTNLGLAPSTERE